MVRGIGAPAGAPGWLAACWQPWEMLTGWNAFWGSQWRNWLDALVSAPNPWLPALAEGRRDQPLGIDFFLPWMPRIDAVIMPLDEIGGREAIRVMMRAALPFSDTSSAGEWVDVDATVTHGRRIEDLGTVAAPSEEQALEAAPAVAPRRAKPAAAATAARRTRKPASAQSKSAAAAEPSSVGTQPEAPAETVAPTVEKTARASRARKPRTATPPKGGPATEAGE